MACERIIKAVILLEKKQERKLFIGFTVLIKVPLLFGKYLTKFSRMLDTAGCLFFLPQQFCLHQYGCRVEWNTLLNNNTTKHINESGRLSLTSQAG
jgi:hypothetical protein